jgi:hypothetical protein
LDNPSFEELLELVDRRFFRRKHEVLRPEWIRRLGEVDTLDMPIGGRIHQRQEICRELLEREAHERIRFYRDVAAEFPGSDMFSLPRLEVLRARIMTDVKASVSGLKQDIETRAHSAGTMSKSALPGEWAYTGLTSAILDVVNVELGVLDSEGKLQSRSFISVPTSDTSGRPEGPASDKTTTAISDKDKIHSDDQTTARRGREPGSGPTWEKPVKQWSDLEFLVASLHVIQLRHGDVIENLSYLEFGFADRRGGLPGIRGGRSSKERGPNEAWNVLLEFASRDGRLSTGRSKGHRVDVEELPSSVSSSSAESRKKALERLGAQIRQIRKILKQFFQLDNDPIPYDNLTGEYRTAFKISRGRTS